MINLDSILKMVHNTIKVVNEEITKEIEEFKIKEKNENQKDIIYYVVEPILVSALGGILSLFAMIQYPTHEVVDITKMLYEEQLKLEQEYQKNKKTSHSVVTDNITNSNKLFTQPTYLKPKQDKKDLN